MSCPDAATIQSLLDGSAHPADRAAVLPHAEECDACRALLGELVRQGERAPALGAKVVGPDHPNNGWPLVRGGQMLARLRRYPEARERIHRALTLFEKTNGPLDGGAVSARHALADTYLREGRYADALAEDERALATMDKTRPPDNVDTATPLTGIGEAQIALGHAAAAVPFLERARALRVAGGAP